MKKLDTRSKLNLAFAELRGIIEQERFRLEEFDFYIADSILSNLRQLEIICIEAAEPEGPTEPHFLSQKITSKDASGVFKIFCMLLTENLASHPLFYGIDSGTIAEIVADFAKPERGHIDNLTLNSFNARLADHIIEFFDYSENCSLGMFVEVAVREATGQGGRLHNNEFDEDLIIINAKNIVRSVFEIGQKTNSSASKDDEKNLLALRQSSSTIPASGMFNATRLRA